ncbi:MAG: GAF domain-containing protein [Candidatus Phytoplasma sp.]|nr:GAF domain-containing protein [Phytoplasma sp.]
MIENVNKTIENSNIGSYLGIQIVFKNGQRFGALCAAHHDSSKFDEGDIKLLEKIANLF